MSVTPNMNMTLPTVSDTTGPDWADQLNTALEVVDDHDHSSGKGQKITPAGMDINANLDMDENSLINVNTMELVNQSAALTGVSNACTVQFVDGNFYIINSGGTAVQITDGNAIVSTVVVPASPLMPAGTVLDFAGSTVPAGFLLCDGSLVSRATYSDLFTAIGTTWGAGDGSTTFALPDFSGKTSIGRGTYTDTVSGSVTRSLAQDIGTAAHILTEAQMPSHTHTSAAHAHGIAYSGTLSYSGGGGNPGTAFGGAVNQSTESATPGPTGYTGSGSAHNNMQPSLVVTKMIKT